MADDKEGINAILDARFNHNSSGRKCVGQQKRETARALRVHRERGINSRKLESDRRRALPETRCDKIEKKWHSQWAKNTKRKTKFYTCKDVESSHRQMIENMDMIQEDHRLSQEERVKQRALMDVYLKNYESWTTSKRVQMSMALEEDERERKKALRERELTGQQLMHNRHKRAMSSTLKEIATDYKENSGGASKRFKTLLGYFVKKSGDNEKRLLQMFNRFYFCNILGSSIQCHTFPEYEQSDEESDEDLVSDKHTKVCHVCHSECIIDHKHGEVVCPQCGVSRSGGVGVGIKQTFSESQASTRSGAPYVRSSHVSIIFARRGTPCCTPSIVFFSTRVCL